MRSHSIFSRIAAVTVFAALVITFSASCASIICGTSQDVSISSTPSGATVKVNGQNRGITPVTMNLKRSKNYVVRLELDGYQPYEVALTKGVNGWVFGNIVFGGIIGLVIDVVDGAIYTVKPDNVMANLARADDGAVLAVKVASDKPDNAKKIGQMKATDLDHKQQLLKLKDLHEAGLLTEEEYAKKRSELIESL